MIERKEKKIGIPPETILKIIMVSSSADQRFRLEYGVPFPEAHYQLDQRRELDDLNDNEVLEAKLRERVEDLAGKGKSGAFFVYQLAFDEKRDKNTAIYDLFAPAD